MAWALDRTVRVSAGSVAWGSAGQDTPALVLVHGWPWSSFAWHRLIAALSDRFTLFWYDMPGYGRSGMDPEQATGLDVQSTVFVEMLDHWGLERPAVLAHDIGGAVALRAHLLHGTEFSRMALTNVVALRPWGSEFFDHVRRYVDAFTGLPPHIHAAVVRSYISGAIVGDIDEADLEALATPWLSEAGRLSFYRQFAQADEGYTSAFEDRLHTIRCPVDILWGSRDPWIPLERGRQLHAAIPGATFVEIADAGHLTPLEAPHALAAEIGTPTGAIAFGHGS